MYELLMLLAIALIVIVHIGPLLLHRGGAAGLDDPEWVRRHTRP